MFSTAEYVQYNKRGRFLIYGDRKNAQIFFRFNEERDWS